MFTAEISKEDIEDIRKFVGSGKLVGVMNSFGLNAVSMLVVLQAIEDYCTLCEKRLNNE